MTRRSFVRRVCALSVIFALLFSLGAPLATAGDARGAGKPAAAAAQDAGMQRRTGPLTLPMGGAGTSAASNNMLVAPDKSAAAVDPDGLTWSAGTMSLPESADDVSVTRLAPSAVGDLFANGMETWPGPWTAGSPLPQSWGQASYRKTTGSYSAYCAGGYVTPPGDYANDSSTAMIAGPFDLSSATAATLSWDMWLNLESGWDWLYVGASANGFDFNTEYWSGDSGGWEIGRSLNLADFYGDGTTSLVASRKFCNLPSGLAPV